VSWLDSETGEIGKKKLVHGSGEAEQWYRQLPRPTLIGVEATGTVSGLSSWWKISGT